MTQLDIYNMALGLAGSSQQITALTTEEPKPQDETMCDLYWPLALEATARAHDWKRLTAREKLVLADGPPETDGSVFDLPDDCLRVLGPVEETAWRVEGHYLIADATDVTIRYIQAPTTFTDPLFVEALVLRLGAYLSMALGQIAIKREQLDMWVQQVCMPLGRFVDSTEQSVRTLKAATWRDSRR